MGRACIVALVLVCGCSRGEGDNGSFFSGGSLGSSATAPDDEPDVDVDDDDDDDDGDGESGSATTGDPPGSGDGTGGPGSGGPGETGAGDDTGASAADESSTGPFMPGNGQPDSGMYAHCYEPDVAACTPSAPLCLMMDSLTEGFCTHDDCTIPSDCNAAPLDATATPFCFSAEDGGGSPVGLCALDCGAGRSCPAGMQCAMNVAFGPDFPTHDICI